MICLIHKILSPNKANKDCIASIPLIHDTTILKTCNEIVSNLDDFREEFFRLLVANVLHRVISASAYCLFFSKIL